MPHEPAPFALLGDKLKDLREQHKETLAEAAGAVELAEEQLQRIEQGMERPSEEILMLLISHFGMKEDDAVHLWELAGYDNSDNDDATDKQATKTVVMSIALDPRVMYSDQVHVAGNPNGIVFSFMQPGGGNLPAMPVARVGMSRDQAGKMLHLLHETLRHLDSTTQPKQLPPSDTQK